MHLQNKMHLQNEMRFLNKIHSLSKLTCLVLLLLPVITFADAKEMLAQRLEALKSMQAEFEQTTANERGDIINTSLGSLALASGGRFCIQTRTPFPQLLVADGKDLYTYDEDLAQVIVKPLGQDIKQVPILLFGNADLSFLEDYEVSLTGPNSQAAFSLRPRITDSVFQTLTLQFDGDTPSAISLVDSLGQTTSIQLSAVGINQPIPAAMFQYQIPDGVDLIDDR